MQFLAAIMAGRVLGPIFLFLKKVFRFLVPLYAPVYLVSLFVMLDEIDLGLHVFGMASIYYAMRRLFLRHRENSFLTVMDRIASFSVIFYFIIYPFISPIINSINL